MSNAREKENMHYDHEIRLALLENTTKTISDTLIRLETKMDTNHKELKEEIKDVRSEIKDVRSEMKSYFRWQLSAMGTTIIFILGIIGAFYNNVGHCLKWF